MRAELAGAGGVGPAKRKVVRQMGADGWLGVGLARRSGAAAASRPVEQFIWFDESMRAGAPVPMLTINTVGPTIMNFGSDEQKEFFLPKILKGEIHFCIGYSEPGAGTDLAALRTKAERDGDEYVINGQKMWTSLASDADYVWLAVRTNPNVKKHKGISLFVIPMDTPGIKVVPIHVMGESEHQPGLLRGRARPGDARGSARRTRAGSSSPTSSTTSGSRCARRASSSARSTDVREWAQDRSCADGRRVIDQEWVQLSLARVHARLEFLRLINWKIAWAATQGRAAPGRRVGDQGVRHRVLPRGVPAPDGDHRAALVPQGRRARARCCRRASSTSTAA